MLAQCRINQPKIRNSQQRSGLALMMNRINRSLVQFESGGFLLTGQWDGPLHPAGATPGVIFCHGFTGNRFESRRLFARLSAILADAGIWTFRFDHRGCGESDGDFADFTAAGLLEDLDAALAVFNADPRIDHSREAVVGYSLGGLSASYLLHKHNSFKTAVLWAPVANPAIIRDRLANYPDFLSYKWRGFFDYMGSRVSAGYIDEIGKLQPVEWARGFERPIYFAQAEGDAVVKSDQVRTYLEARRNPEDRLLLIEGGDHFFGAPNNIDQVLVTSAEWLNTKLLATRESCLL
jgi:pimeloyl-ACP methyl ester carboxylesterase